MASLVLGVAGAAIGFAIGGPVGAQWGFAAGSLVGGLLFPGSLPDQVGPRLSDLKVQSSSYGGMIPIYYGTMRGAGQVIWATDIQEHRTDTTQGGKGGPSQTTTTFSYSSSFAISICEGQAIAIRRVWADSTLIYDVSANNTGATQAEGLQMQVYLGTETQLPDPTIEAALGVGNVPGYRGQVYVVFTDFALAKFGNRIPNFSFEVVMAGSVGVPAQSTYGEYYDSGRGDSPFRGDFDANGNFWLSTMTGHAVYDAMTGIYSIDNATTARPQFQQYDAVTKKLIWAYNVPTVHEIPDPQTGVGVNVYPMQGDAVCSGDYFFIGRGLAGLLANGYWDSMLAPNPYVHGMAVNTKTHEVMSFFDNFSSGQASGGLTYFPSVPIPLIDNNKVYFASSNGITSGLALGYFPQSQAVAGSPDFDPVPDRSGPEPLWRAPYGWFEALPKNATYAPGPVTSTYITLPFWSRKAYVLHDPDAVIVQGYGFISWVAHSPVVTSFDISGPSIFNTNNILGNAINDVVLVWDKPNDTIWMFGPDVPDGSPGDSINKQMFAVKREAGALIINDTGFEFPVISGQPNGNNVIGGTIDKTTGYLRLILGGGGDPAHLILFNPLTQTTLESLNITIPVSGAFEKMIDFPDERKVGVSNGAYIGEIPYGPAVTSNQILLGDIVSSLSVKAGLTTGDINVAALTDMVDGYAITRQSPVRSPIEQLQQAYFFDAVESDSKVKFVKRGGSSVVTIIADDLAAHPYGDSLPDILTTTRVQEVELPSALNVTYLNPGADYQNNTQQSRRLVGSSGEAVNVELPIVLSDSQAKQIADASMFNAWTGRTSYKFQTTNKYAKYEPTDVMIVNNKTLRVVKKDEGQGLIKWEAVAELAEIYTQASAGVSGSTGGGQTVSNPGNTSMELLDIPLLRDIDDNAGFYYASRGDDTSWPGAVLYKSADGGATYVEVGSAITAATIGLSTIAPGDFTGGYIFDYINTVTVTLFGGATLSSATELAVLNGANIALLGNELIQFKTATLNLDGTYTLSGLLRGQKGTGWAIPSHGTGERFISISSSSVFHASASNAEIGLQRSYKAVTIGKTIASAPAQTFTDNAIALKPYAPCQLAGTRDGSNNLTITWVRRTRYAWDSLDAREAPLGETSESYDVVIYSDNTYTTVKRTFAAVSSPTQAYSAANQTTDGYTPGNTIYMKVYQNSSVVGRGYPLIGSV